MTNDAAAEAALHELAELVAAAGHDEPVRRALAAVVLEMERVAGAALGDTDGEPVVVLQRRFGRAHLRVEAGALRLDQVREHLAALQRPAVEQELPVGTAPWRVPQAGLLAEC